MAAADWPTVQTILRQATGHDDLSFLIGAAAGVPASEQWLPDIVRNNLDDPLPLLVQGVRHIGWAWEARTGRLAEYVDADQFALFFERLRIAEDCLQSVVRREPDNATAWASLITTARGLQLGPAESRRRFDQAIMAHPGHLTAHNMMLQNLCAKWSGSHEAMFDFARTAFSGAAPGSDLGVMIAYAHLERMITYDTVAEMFGYLRSAEVATELAAAADRSVRHAQYKRTRYWAVVHNTFAAVLGVSRQWRAAAYMFDVVEDTVTESPWRYFKPSDPGAFFCALRNDTRTNVR
jgi:hypothetical protein